MKRSSKYLKVRVYPSLDFTLGSSSPATKDNTKSSTEIDTDEYRVGYKDTKIFEIKNNEAVNQRAIASRGAGLLGEEKILELLNEQEKQYQKCIECNDSEGATRALDMIASLVNSRSLMGLSSATISHKAPRKQRGLSGITPFGKRMIRSSLAVLEEKWGRECLTLGTCTLPALSSEEFDKVCSNWSELTRKFFQELSRELIRRGLEGEYCQVTEIQEKRFNNSGDVALHLHWVAPGKRHRSDHWALRPEDVRGIWQRLLANIIGREPDCTAATRIEKPRSSLANELAKYLSKGVGAILAVVKAGKAHLLPSSWWGAAKHLKIEVKSQILEISGYAALWLDRNLKQMKSDGQLWYVDIFIEMDDREFRAGAVGRFNERAEIDKLKAIHAQESIVSKS